MREYVLRHKNNHVFLKYMTEIDYRHYTVCIKEATIFDYATAYKFKKKFKHPENWQIQRIDNYEKRK